MPWTPDLSPRRLIDNVIHVLEINLESLAVPTGCRNWLESRELKRYQGIKAEDAARRHLAIRCSLRDVLSAYLDSKPEAVVIGTEPGGKPFVMSAETPLHFNLTHTGDRALVALSKNCDIGIDTEKIRSMERMRQIAGRVFTDQEQALIEQATEARRPEVFFHLWTRMEARQKSSGEGIFGSRINVHSVGSCSLPSPDGYMTSLAWSRPEIDPVIERFVYAPDTLERYHSAGLDFGREDQ